MPTPIKTNRTEPEEPYEKQMDTGASTPETSSKKTEENNGSHSFNMFPHHTQNVFTPSLFCETGRTLTLTKDPNPSPNRNSNP